MVRKPTLKKPQPLTAAIIAYMQAGEERGDAQWAGLRVRCLALGQKVFFYRYRARDGALREIRLSEVGPLMLTKARDAVARKRLEREQAIGHAVPAGSYLLSPLFCVTELSVEEAASARRFDTRDTR